MSDYSEMTDEQLIHHLRDGKEEIVEFLLEKYKNLVRKKANAMYLIGGETEDLIQEGMIGLYRAIREYDVQKESSFFHYADLCISRQLYTAIEASRRQKHAPLNSYVSLSEGNSDDSSQIPTDTIHVNSPEMMMIDLENVATLRSEINQCLSQLERQVLDLYLEGNNYRQIAEQMNKSPKSIDNALQRIRNKIAQMIQTSIDSKNR